MSRRSPGKDIDAMLLAPAWGALWGAALGMCGLAPEIVASHHIRPVSASQWTVLLGGFAIVFVIFGALLGFVGGFLLAIVEQFLVRGFRDRIWAFGLLTGSVCFFGYVLEVFVVGFTAFGTFNAAAFYSDEMKLLLALAFTMTICLGIAYRLIVLPAHRITPILLVIVLSAASAAGAIAAVQHTDVGRLTTADVGALTKHSTASGDTPLLFVGVDGATWRVLEPAMERGLAPTFRAIAERGTSGNIEALWPPYWSGAAWGSILTGLSRDTTGVYEDLGALAPGLPPFQVPLSPSLKLNPMFTVRAYLQAMGLIRLVPQPRSLLRGKPVWQLLHDAGVDTAVIRFRFTYPPVDEADVIVSDWVANDSWESLGVHNHSTPDTVAPPQLTEQLLMPFRSQESDLTLFEQLIPGPLPKKPSDAVLEPFGYLRASADVDERTFQAAMTVLKRNPKQPFLAVYVVGIDSAEHAFWQYRFPKDFPENPPSAEDVKQFAPVIDRYVEFVDEQLKDLLSLYEQEPNIVLVSDHGHGPALEFRGWRGWHHSDGFFLAAGPSVPKGKERISVSYYDLVPTLISLKGFDKPAALPGKPLFEQVTRIVSPTAGTFASSRTRYTR